MNDNVSAFNAMEYDDKIKMTIPFYEDFYNQIIDISKMLFKKPLNWLDVGCGTGKMAELILENTAINKLVLCDNSIQMIEIAKKRVHNKKVEFIHSSIDHMDRHNAFDVVTAVQVFHYFQREERINAIKKSYKALKSKGIFITFENFAPYSEMGKVLFLKRWKEYQLSQGKSYEECETHISRYGKTYFPITISEHLDVLNQCGFTNTEIIWVSNMQVGLLGEK